MNKKNSKIQEFDNFSNLAHEWWDPEGKFKILHQILPLRMEYILKNIDTKIIKNLNILDLGCGGGLSCEAFAKLGAKVTGVDFVEKNIEVAKKHALNSKLNINYYNQDLENLKITKKYDLILLLEVIEHIDNWQLLIKKITKMLNPNGLLIVSTINKTILSKIFAINLAENILGWVPKNTHSYDKLIKPVELKKTLIKNNLSFIDIAGMNYNPIVRKWSLSNDIYPINYFCSARKI